MTNPTYPTIVTDDDGYDDRRDRLLQTLGSGADGKFSLRKDTSNLFRDRVRQSRRRLDLRGFNHVLTVDPVARSIEAEGMTAYDDLVAATRTHNVLPPVVPQLKSITLGGAVAGIGIEASSFRYGLVHESVTELDVLCGGGRVVKCRPDNEHRDLFFGFPNSYGTLGYALRIKIDAIASGRFVKLRHRRYEDLDGYFAALACECRSDADYVEGVAFGPGDLYITTGRFVERAPYASDYTFRDIYYRSIRERETDFLTVHDFLWRWDTDWFWCSKNVGAQHPLIRRLYGRRRLGSRTYQRIMRFNARLGLTAALDRARGGHTESVIQDVDIPIANAASFLAYFQREIGIAPVWVCPLIAREDADRYPLYMLRPGELYVNFGFWDVKRCRTPLPPHYFNRNIEAEVAAQGGIKSLYSDSFYEREEFDRIYGGQAYRSLKTRYDPAAEFPDLYDKCVLRR